MKPDRVPFGYVTMAPTWRGDLDQPENRFKLWGVGVGRQEWEEHALPLGLITQPWRKPQVLSVPLPLACPGAVPSTRGSDRFGEPGYGLALEHHHTAILRRWSRRDLGARVDL